MTHARQRNSLRRYRSDSKEQVNCRIHAEIMGRTWPECPMLEKKIKRHAYKRGRDKEIKQQSADSDRKLYPLRGRQGMSDVGSLNCCVLLTRLEEGGTCKGSMKAVTKNKGKRNMKVKKGRTKPCKCRKKGCKACQPMPGPKSNPKPDKTALYLELLEPRKRRLASLNAEAVNSLLLFREDSQMSKKQQNSQKGDGELPKGELDSSRKGLEGQKRTRTGEGDEGTNPKKTKKAKTVSEHLDQLNLNSPAPRRLAGLNAAALLKLTSTSSGAKRRAKTDTKPGSGGARTKQLQGKVKKHHCPPCLSKPPVSQQCCSLCKKEALKTDALWEGTSGGHDFIKPGYQCRSMLSYSLKPVKEERTETDVNSCYCCSQERSVEYCHRLALFLGQKAYPESEQHSLPSVKGFLPSPHTLTHPALTLGAHSYPCYPGYYVHIAHHGTSSLPVSTSPGPRAPPSVPPITLCPTGVQRPKLLPSPVSHPSGIPHPVYCSSVGTCYGEPCRISGCAYRHTQPIANRGCSFSAGCSSCSHKIKMEDYPYPLDKHSPSISMPPSLPLSVCPIPSVPAATQPMPHLQSPLPDTGHPQVQLHVGRECPQSAKPPSSSRSAIRDTAVCPHVKEGQLGASHSSPSTKQAKISRRRATNGWLPVGTAAEKEVFIVGEESPALRRCYEGVQRDGEVIRVRDTVLLRSGPRKKSLPYVAKVSAFWEDPESGELMMSLFWYYRPEHTQGGRNPSMHCENEIFASRHQDENSVACIEDKCYVLTLAQYCRFCALVKRREEARPKSAPLVPPAHNYAIPAHRSVPADINPDLVFVCRHVYDFRYGRLLKNLQ
ncbi:bromo adjacent homology domain-containing 1 protein isoform X1 [Neoarius graeffei]|uniref:bromo adjacent homology domain-containing 1 protein isoform X1 n=1 Tax=Neoarius graeffei TaxID=443677 RepID=UPI00298C89B6|nr:bromo adjacent homology domain-containing 1 protein isoform X1 [Neoarius graeffei]XP_060790039.1 bromo adjacent homology domain-containing 1 protein isoform X1 [Neoarius graeffei]XP_060790040.1 bromo adjacent homology domain-containing 1 protein isoform X1 [Neoarius graeffei]XP_060790041.1 bromo adjacent homology domain-containing 1 protein isoform X1 [Neoarius graeffei]